MTATELSYIVSAGKYDGQDRNCKYCEAFGTLAEALRAYDRYDTYPWVELEHDGILIDVDNL